MGASFLKAKHVGQFFPQSLGIIMYQLRTWEALRNSYFFRQTFPDELSRETGDCRPNLVDIKVCLLYPIYKNIELLIHRHLPPFLPPKYPVGVSTLVIRKCQY